MIWRKGRRSEDGGKAELGYKGTSWMGTVGAKADLLVEPDFEPHGADLGDGRAEVHGGAAANKETLNE